MKWLTYSKSVTLLQSQDYNRGLLRSNLGFFALYFISLAYQRLANPRVTWRKIDTLAVGWHWGCHNQSLLEGKTVYTYCPSHQKRLEKNHYQKGLSDYKIRDNAKNIITIHTVVASLPQWSTPLSMHSLVSLTHTRKVQWKSYLTVSKTKAQEAFHLSPSNAHSWDAPSQDLITTLWGA